MTQATPFEVRCEQLQEVADVIDDITWRAEEDFRKLQTAVADVVAGAPGTKTAEAATRFGDRWRRQFGHRIDELEGFARSLRQAADNYCLTDQDAAGKLDRVPKDGGWLDEHAPGGGYIPPNSDYASG